jgi:hypothetical protein
MKNHILSVSALMFGLLCSACGNNVTDSLLATKINSFKATIDAVVQTPPVTIPAGKDVKFDWSVDSLASAYNANLYVSDTTSPGNTPLWVKVSTSGSDGTTCKTEKNSVLGKTFMTCNGLTNAYDITHLVGTSAYIVLKVNSLNDSATASIKIYLQ